MVKIEDVLLNIKEIDKARGKGWIMQERKVKPLEIVAKNVI